MSITYGELKARVGKVLQDPNARTFTEDLVEELIASALVEVGRIAPEQFTEDLTPVDNQLTYTPRADAFANVETAFTGEADTELFTCVGHGLNADDAIKFTALSGGTGLTVDTTYYVIEDELDEDVFQVSTTVGGAAVAFSTDVTSGTWTFVGGGEAVPEVEVTRVEVWDPTQSPERYVMTVPPAATEYARGSDSGWSLWGGLLTIPSRVAAGLVGYDYVLRVWGYSPYVHPVADGDLIAVSKEVEQAMLWFVRIEAIDMMLASRDLFTQWQTRTGNTDTTLAGLLNQRSIAEQAWTRRSRAIQRLRSEV